MGSTLFRDPQALSSTLASLGMLQPRAFGSLNRIDPLDSVCNYYILCVCVHTHTAGALHHYNNQINTNFMCGTENVWKTWGLRAD